MLLPLFKWYQSKNVPAQPQLFKKKKKKKHLGEAGSAKSRAWGDFHVTLLACVTPKAAHHLRLLQENAQISW